LAAFLASCCIMATQAVKARLGENGRLVIPAPLRKELGLRTSQEVLLRVEGGELRVSTAEAGFRRAHDLIARYIPADVALTEELIEDRRREAARDDLG
jgi:bifunctional DNA-binding transcriptional regulator/antitoxin component of YhaV-PrlF toxin-antitoxin module